jgi:hypothetical protein
MHGGATAASQCGNAAPWTVAPPKRLVLKNKHFRGYFWRYFQKAVKNKKIPGAWSYSVYYIGI